MNAALTRYQILAYVVGVALLVLALVAMPLKYLADEPALVALVGPVHGFLYMGYLVVSLDVAVRQRWSMWRTLGVMLAGTVPFVSFVVERKVTRQVRESALA